MQPELGILADDLTGATDTGLQFAKCGRRTLVSLSWAASSPCDVLVFDADSRARSAAEAWQRVVVATQKLRAAGPHRYYKKIDSTGRGNLGAEVEAMLEALGAPLALVCPSFPPLGRTVRQGWIYVRDTPLDQTEFAEDPLWPATTASLTEILARQTTLPIDQLTLADVRHGPALVRRRLRDLRDRGIRIVVGDAEAATDLRCLIEAIRQSDDTILPVGSAGLAEWLAGSLTRPAHPPKAITLSADPILVVAGTMNRVGLSQLARLTDHGVRSVHVNADQAIDDLERVCADAATALVSRLREGGCVVLTLADENQRPPDLSAVASVRGVDLAIATERLVAALGLSTKQAIERIAPSALILTGGDTARAVCAAVGAQGLEVCREVAPGIPLSLLEGGRWDGLPVVTKAGGFGATDTLVQVVNELEGLRT